MIKYFNTLANERGDVLPNYRLQVVDGVGAVVTIYADKAGTRFTDASGNIVNYATASSNGRVSFYWTPAVGQTLQTLDVAGDLVDAEADFADSYVLGQLPGNIAQSAVTNLTTDLAAKAATADLASTATGKGAALVGFKRSEAGSVARTAQDKLDESVSVKDFGATGDGITDDTAAIQAAIDAVYDAGGGTLYFPEGNYRVTSLVKNWTSPISIVFQGAGKMATVLQKIGASTTPIIDFSADVGLLETYSAIADMRIVGNAKTHHGIRLTRWARFELPNVRVEACDVGIENLGSLVFSVYDPTIQANNIGYRSRVSLGIRANLVQFFGGNVTGNSTFGLDVGDAAGMQVIGTDISANGTAADTATGGIILRATMDDEFGYASFTMRGAWMEANKGWTFRSEACAGLFIDLDDVFLLSNESGRAADIGAVFACKMNGVIAGSVGDTVNVAAGRSIIHNSIIGTLADTSTRRQHVNISTTASEIENALKSRFRSETLANDAVLFGRKDNITGGNGDDYEFYHPNALREFWFNVAGGPALRVGANAIGFYGTAPQVKATLAAAATDAATTQTLANDIRAKLIALGLFS